MNNNIECTFSDQYTSIIKININPINAINKYTDIN